MAEIIWSQLAEDQLRRAVQYIQVEQGNFYANLVLNKVIEAIENLEQYPRLGPIEPQLRQRKESFVMLSPGVIK